MATRTRPLTTLEINQRWENILTEDEEAAAPSRGETCVQHTPKTHGRRSKRFPDVNITATAAALGVTKSHLAKILAGLSRPSIKLALAVAAALDVDVKVVIALFNEEESKARRPVKIHQPGTRPAAAGAARG